jgi:hypothetical protein
MTSEQFWEEEFGDKNESHDFAGRAVRKSEYGVRTDYGWTVDHILPLALNGPDNWENYQITHFLTNEEKADKNTFEANGKYFQVKKIKNLFFFVYMANYPYKKCHKKYCVIIRH